MVNELFLSRDLQAIRERDLARSIVTRLDAPLCFTGPEEPRAATNDIFDIARLAHIGHCRPTMALALEPTPRGLHCPYRDLAMARALAGDPKALCDDFTEAAELAIVGDSRPFGMAFSFGGIPLGLVLHNGRSSSFGGGTLLEVKPGRHLTLIRTSRLVQSLAVNWRFFYSAKALKEAKVFSAEEVLPPSVVHEHGDGVRAKLLFLIRRLTVEFLRAPAYEWVTVSGGERQVKANQQVLASTLGCSVPSIATAVKQLTKARLIQVTRTRSGNVLSLVGSATK